MGVIAKQGKGKVYYCKLCKDYIFLAKNFLFETCPLRPDDSSIVVDEVDNEMLTTCKDGETVLIHRPEGYEKQTRIHCSTCNCSIGYHQQTQYLYLYNDAIIE